MEEKTERRLNWFMFGWAVGMFCCAILFAIIYWDKGVF